MNHAGFPADSLLADLEQAMPLVRNPFNHMYGSGKQKRGEYHHQGMHLLYVQD